MKIQVKPGLEIGDDCSPFIIAEVGSNWCTLEDCLLSIRSAWQCGADAVKFQLFTNEALYGYSDPEFYGRDPKMLEKANEGLPPDHDKYERLWRHELPLEWLPHLANEAKHIGIEFMCSAFSPELIDAVDPYVNIHKVASAELTHLPMLEKLREIGKPVILSTGASGATDINLAKTVLGSVPKVLLYCIANYPAQEVHLGNIQKLRDTFGTLSGYSDHTLDIACIPHQAVKMGACVLEKHFTAVDFETPDSAHSLHPHQFKRMVDVIRNQFCPELGYTPEEKAMIVKHNRRLIATQSLKPGDTLRFGSNFGVYRSLKEDTHAFSPWLLHQVNGREVKRDIEAGSGIGPGDV